MTCRLDGRVPEMAVLPCPVDGSEAALVYDVRPEWRNSGTGRWTRSFQGAAPAAPKSVGAVQPLSSNPGDCQPARAVALRAS